MEKSITETECTALENLFHQIISNMKTSFPAWEDLTGKAAKLNAVLRTTISATSAFLEAFQKVANLALSSRGATSDVGSTLTRLCLRQRAIEDKLKLFAGSIVESLVTPLQEHLEEWKKTVALLDKDHAKESKRAHQDIKKAYTETVRLKKKSKKGGKAETAKQLDHAVVDYNEKYEALEVIEKNAVRAALVQEHHHFCHFILCLKPLMDCEVAMLAEMSHVEQLMAGLNVQGSAPLSYPDMSDCFSTQDGRKETTESMAKLPEESPGGSQGSRKSSLSSASSGCVHSPSRTSMSGSLQNSSGRNSECRDASVSIAKSSSAQTVPLQPQTSWSSWQEQTQTMPRLSTSQEAPPGDQPSIERQVSYDSSCPRELAGVHQYAVPCSISATEKSESAGVGVAAGDPDAAVMNLRRTSAPADGGKKLTAVPLEGYVNMNQLACLAVQQQELNLKKEQMMIDDKNDCLDLPPPPLPDASIGSSTLPAAFPVPSGVNTVKRAASNKTSRTAEDALLTGEFENLADSLLESSCFLPSSAASSYRSLPRPQRAPGASPSAPQGLKYSASQRFQHGATMIRQGPMRDRSLPPISRKSPKTATLPLHKNSSPTFPVAHQNTSLRRGTDYRKQIEQLYESRLEVLPPPPPPETRRPVFTIDDGAFDDLPLPPPPEELRDTAVCPQVLRKAESGDLIATKRQGSVVSSHAGLIESLNSKFSGRQTLPREAIAANFARGRRASDAMCVEDTRSGNSPPSPDTLSASIQRGVHLRRTVTNDRSAPRLPSNHL